MDIYKYSCGDIGIRSWVGAGSWSGGVSFCYELEAGNPISPNGAGTYHLMYTTDSMNNAVANSGYSQFEVYLSGKYRTGYGLPAWSAVLRHGSTTVGSWSQAASPNGGTQVRVQQTYSLARSQGGKYYLN